MSKFEKGASQQTSLLDVLKKKMRQAREEAEQARDEADEVKRLLEEERKKREDVSSSDSLSYYRDSCKARLSNWETQFRYKIIKQQIPSDVLLVLIWFNSISFTY